MLFRSPCVILPSYNGARRLPLFTPLLAMLLAQKGLRVLIHGGNTESTRVSCQQVLQALGWPCATQPTTLLTEPITYVPLSELCPGLWRLLQVRGEIGLRNSGHSMVKLMNPVQGACLQVASYTHPEYLHSMTATLQLVGQHALLLRATEGEPVAHLAVGTTSGLRSARLTRLVVMPEWQGAGVGIKFLEYVARRWLNGENRYGKRMTGIIHTSHPGLVAALARSKRWVLTSQQMGGGNKAKSQKAMAKSGLSVTAGYGGHLRAVSGFRFVGDRP